MTRHLLDRLRRVTNHRPWVPEIDGLRFFAIFSVVLYHLCGELQNRSGRIIPIELRYRIPMLWIGNGDRGVRLFFVISGLVLALPFARHFLTSGRPVSLRRYFMRRVTRLEPPYIASILFFTVAIALYSRGLAPGYFRHALASLFYVHNLTYGTFSPVNMVTWSLEIEIQFYLLAPLFMQIFRVRGKAARRFIFLAAIVVCGVLQHPFFLYPRFQMSIANYLQYFLAGLLLADIFVVDLPQMQSSWKWDLAGLAVIFVSLSVPSDRFWAHAILPVTLGLLCLASMRGVALRRVVSNPWIAVIGGMCYSIYLLHMILVAIFFKITRHLIVQRFDFLGNLAVQAVVVLPAILAGSIVFYLAIERPCMDPEWPQKLMRRLRGRSAAPDLSPERS